MGKLQSLLNPNKSKKAFKDACLKYDLVYFGDVSQHTDEHEMVRGFTLSPSHVDKHYCVGTVGGKDVVLMQRTDTISFPDKPSKAYTWIILQIDLKHNLPTHVLLNSYHYEPIVYDHIFAKLHHLQLYHTSLFSHHDPKFADFFKVYAPLQHTEQVISLLDPSITAILGHHFSDIDYELLQDNLIIYIPSTGPTPQQFNQIFKAGLWLADILDKNS